MAKVMLLPRDVEKINEIVQLSNIVSVITVECVNSSGIGVTTTMSWDTEYNGLNTRMTVNIVDESSW